MRIKYSPVSVAVCVVLHVFTPVFANAAEKAVKLVYHEQEPAVDPYTVTYTVTSEYIRIDDDSDDSGYILFDIQKNRIYSVSHFDQSILVVNEYPSIKQDTDFNIELEYRALENAPAISGKQVYTYRVNAVDGDKSETCMDIQLVPGLLPEVATSLQSFQKLISGQQANNLDKTPEEFRTPCYLVDQVFNHGEYYNKGLPIQEWHSNEKRRRLVNFEQVSVTPSIFGIPQDYRQYSLK